MDKQLRRQLAKLVYAFGEENGMEEPDQVMLMHLLNSDEKLLRFFDWVESKLENEKLNAMNTEICRAAVHASKETGKSKN